MTTVRYDKLPRPKLALCKFLRRTLFYFTVYLAFAGHAFAREPNYDDFAKQLGREITKAHLRSVAVADFLTSDGKFSDQCWYLANLLSDSWLRHGQEFRVFDRSELEDTKVSATDLGSAEVIRRIGSAWGVDALVTGVLQVLPDHYVLTVSARRVADNTIVATASGSLPHSRILDLLGSNGVGEEVASAQFGGPERTAVLTAPTCVRCPDPDYSDRARKANIQGTTVLSVLVSTSGRASRIGIVKGLRYGLTEKAIEAVSEWEFKPGADKDGKHVSVIIPIEVTFRLSKN